MVRTPFYLSTPEIKCLKIARPSKKKLILQLVLKDNLKVPCGKPLSKEVSYSFCSYRCVEIYRACKYIIQKHVYDPCIVLHYNYV